MDEIKQLNFEREHAGIPFPRYQTLSLAEATHVGERVAASVGIPRLPDTILFARALSSRMHPVPGIGCMADARSFDVLEVFGRLGIAPRADIYINWRHFVEVDRMSTADVARFFSSLWYPGPDEIDLFDDSFAWVLSISGEGQPVYWRTPRGRGILGGGTTLR